eukprot:1157377-Pelagomonas_calceolata.AAC.3
MQALLNRPICGLRSCHSGKCCNIQCTRAREIYPKASGINASFSLQKTLYLPSKGYYLCRPYCAYAVSSVAHVMTKRFSHG